MKDRIIDLAALAQNQFYEWEEEPMESNPLDALKSWIATATNRELVEAVDVIQSEIHERMVISEAMEAYDELDIHEQRENFADHHPRDRKRGVEYPLGNE